MPIITEFAIFDSPANIGDGTKDELVLNLTAPLGRFGLTGAQLQPRMNLTLVITREDGSQEQVEVLCRIDTLNEVEYFKAGGILHYVLRQLIAS